MPADWSLILNVLLLAGVVVAIGRLMKTRRENLNYERYQPAAGRAENSAYKSSLQDDIIAVRKIDIDAIDQDAPVQKSNSTTTKNKKPLLVPQDERLEEVSVQKKIRRSAKPALMFFLLAKEGRQFAGYELLQTLLACGLRFGEGQLFHRHEEANGEGEVVCSLAAATASGVFDLQNMGAFNVKGLCLFMHATSDTATNAQYFAIMLETAKQLSEALGAHLLDEKRKPLTDAGIAHCRHVLNIEENELEYAGAI
ncbi:MAG: cell division protein ZipA [Legionella sp.]|nr:MAG: cell division protein ZipA [Legionella sp.]PJD98055.1 MAG: cell division protein ZipA [Legionella sp.]